MVQESPKKGPRGPKTAPRAPKIAPRGPQERPKSLFRWPQRGKGIEDPPPLIDGLEDGPRR
eukprot:7248146-Pyramimonas_sp.AAC.1